MGKIKFKKNTFQLWIKNENIVSAAVTDFLTFVGRVCFYV